MRKATLTLLIVALALGLAAGSVQAAKGKKVRSQVEIEWYDGTPAGLALIGDVHSKKNKCERKREVTLEVAGAFVGTGTTDRTGDWAIPADLVNEPFVASVEKETVGRGDKKLVCKAADSPPIIFEP